MPSTAFARCAAAGHIVQSQNTKPRAPRYAGTTPKGRTVPRHREAVGGPRGSRVKEGWQSCRGRGRGRERQREREERARRGDVYDECWSRKGTGGTAGRDGTDGRNGRGAGWGRAGVGLATRDGRLDARAAGAGRGGGGGQRGVGGEGRREPYYGVQISAAAKLLLRMSAGEIRRWGGAYSGSSSSARRSAVVVSYCKPSSNCTASCLRPAEPRTSHA